jgi:hypothetical protein
VAIKSKDHVGIRWEKWQLSFHSQNTKSPISLCEKQGFDDRTIIPLLVTAVHKQINTKAVNPLTP